MCHNTAEPTMYLLNLLCATIQLSLLCACSAFYVPNSRAYCVPAQPSMCHNTAESTVCLLSLLCATIQLSLLLPCHDTINCIVTLLPQAARLSRYNDCIVTQSPSSKPLLLSQYNLVYCDTISQPSSPQPVTIQRSVL